MKRSSFLLILLLLTGLGWSQSRAERKQLKQERLEANYQEMKGLVESSNFEFVASWASPLDMDVIRIGNALGGVAGAGIFQGGRVNMFGNPNYLRVSDALKADIDMPFFGRVFFPNRLPNNDNNISFKGEITDYKVNYNQKKRRIIIEFQSKEKNDAIAYTLTITSPQNASLNVNSVARQNIRYDGKVQEIKSESDLEK